MSIRRLSTALFVAAGLLWSSMVGCGQSSVSPPAVEEASTANHAGHGADADAAETGVLVEPADEAEAFVALAVAGKSPGGAPPSASAFTWQGGPVLLNVSVFNDWKFDGLPERRTLLHSQTFLPELMPPRPSDDSDAPWEMSFADFTGRVLVIEDDLLRVAYQDESTVRRGDEQRTSKASFHLLVPDEFYRVDVRTRRSFPYEQLKQDDSSVPYFREVFTAGTSQSSLQLPLRIEPGQSEELYSRWPISWGPDDSPLVLAVSVMHLPLPATYDAATLRKSIETLRAKAAADAAAPNDHMLLAISLDMQTRIDKLESLERRKLHQEAVDHLKLAVEARPWQPVYRDLLRLALISLAWNVAQSADHAQAPALLEEMLSHSPAFSDFDWAARVTQQCVYSTRNDEKLDEQQRAKVREEYSLAVADTLRRGLEQELIHAGVDGLRYRMQWLASILNTSRFDENEALQRLQVEFECEPENIAANICKLQQQLEQNADDAITHELLAASYAMQAELERPAGEEAFNALKKAAEHARGAAKLEPDNQVYRRRLRSILLRAGRRAAYQNDYKQASSLSDEALEYDPQWADYLTAAENIWLAGTEKPQEGQADEQASSAARRAAFIALVQRGLEAVRRDRADDYPWLFEQLPSAVPYPVNQWPEFAEFMKTHGGATSANEPDAAAATAD